MHLKGSTLTFNARTQLRKRLARREHCSGADSSTVCPSNSIDFEYSEVNRVGNETLAAALSILDHSYLFRLLLRSRHMVIGFAAIVVLLFLLGARLDVFATAVVIAAPFESEQSEKNVDKLDIDIIGEKHSTKKGREEFQRPLRKINSKQLKVHSRSIYALSHLYIFSTSPSRNTHYTFIGYCAVVSLEYSLVYHLLFFFRCLCSSRRRKNWLFRARALALALSHRVFASSFCVLRDRNECEILCVLSCEAELSRSPRRVALERRSRCSQRCRLR